MRILMIFNNIVAKYVILKVEIDNKKQNKIDKFN